MKIASLSKDVVFNEKKPVIQVLFASDVTKEIRVVLKKGQRMKAHKSPFPIVVELFRGSLDFGVNGEVLLFTSGDLIALGANVIHDLTALEDSIVRLSLSLKDKVERVEKVETAIS